MKINFHTTYFSSIASKLAICMRSKLKENIGKGAMQRIASFNFTYFSSIASKLAICMGINMKRYNMKDLLLEAQMGNFAYAAINVSNMETISAVLGASSELDIPVILQIAPVQMKIQGFTYEEMAAIIKHIAKKYEFGGYALHLDHSTSHVDCRSALQAGFDSIMYDGAMLPFAENVEETCSARNYSKKNCLEGELGVLGGSEGNVETRGQESQYTDPEAAKVFVRLTKVDCLAVSIGNAHGTYIGKPHLDFNVLEEIRKHTDIPLVLHGASGIPFENIFRAIETGITKINYFTEVDEAFRAGFMEAAVQNKYMMEAAKNGQDHMQLAAKNLIYACRYRRIR